MHQQNPDQKGSKRIHGHLKAPTMQQQEQSAHPADGEETQPLLGKTHMFSSDTALYQLHFLYTHLLSSLEIISLLTSISSPMASLNVKYLLILNTIIGATKFSYDHALGNLPCLAL